MLRMYQPITNHPIFSLHSMLEHLVCEVWCNANEGTNCEDILQPQFRVIYNTYAWLKNDVDAVYQSCKSLALVERQSIAVAFGINNRIEDLCNGLIAPIHLNVLPSVVETGMKPLLVKFYNVLLDLAAVAGNKLDYYNELIRVTEYRTCPCCGLHLIESADSDYREDNDHYLPKSEFPFASVNFKNLVPLCTKCNQKHKKSKNPIDGGRLAFYPYSTTPYVIEVKASITDSLSLDFLKLKTEEVVMSFIGNEDKIATWNWLFEIKERYTEQICNFSKTELRILSKKNKKNPAINYSELIDEEIVNLEFDKYDDRKFLKIALFEAVRNNEDWLEVFE